MTTYKYSFKDFNKELMSRAVGVSLGISTKFSVEICNYLRHRNITVAKRILKDVISEKKAIPFKRFTWNLAHKTAIGPGRYPVKAAIAILELIKSAESNAQFKGLSTGNLIIRHICANKASRPARSGRHRGRLGKSTHVEIVLEEVAKKATKERTKKTDIKKPKAKPIAKPKKEVPKEENKDKQEKPKKDTNVENTAEKTTHTPEQTKEVKK